MLRARILMTTLTVGMMLAITNNWPECHEFVCVCVRVLLSYRNLIHENVHMGIRVVSVICDLNQTKAKWDTEPNPRSFTTSAKTFLLFSRKSSSGWLARTSRSAKQAVQCCKSWRSVWFSLLFFSKTFSSSKSKTFPKLQRKRVRTYFMDGGESISESSPVESILKSAISPGERSYSFRKSVASTNGDRYIPLFFCGEGVTR